MNNHWAPVSNSNLHITSVYVWMSTHRVMSLLYRDIHHDVHAPYRHLHQTTANCAVSSPACQYYHCHCILDRLEDISWRYVSSWAPPLHPQSPPEWTNHRRYLLGGNLSLCLLAAEDRCQVRLHAWITSMIKWCLFIQHQVMSVHATSSNFCLYNIKWCLFIQHQVTSVHTSSDVCSYNIKWCLFIQQVISVHTTGDFCSYNIKWFLFKQHQVMSVQTSSDVCSYNITLELNSKKNSKITKFTWGSSGLPYQTGSAVPIQFNVQTDIILYGKCC
jgi:hypothetical protein